MAEQEEFKFPDEKEEAAAPVEDKLEIEVVDDTPEEDRGRTPMPKEIVKELEEDDLEEYSEKVKKRLGQMKKVWHDERREKEREAREKAEAIRLAQQVYEENKQLKQQLGQGRKALVDHATKSATNELAVAKENLKRAYETADASAITEAQEVLTDVKLRLREYQRLKPSLQEEEYSVKPPQQEPAQPQVVDPKAEAWRVKNTWFGANKGMTAFALGLHEELVESGVDPRSDDYYDRVNKTMRKRFPDYFGEEQTQTMEKEEKPTPRTKTANVVAPVTRSSAPKQVRLTPSQVTLAKRLGITPEAYAKELMKQENRNG
jgi:type II secretory pathway pseudopilin PulG